MELRRRIMHAALACQEKEQSAPVGVLPRGTAARRHAARRVLIMLDGEVEDLLAEAAYFRDRVQDRALDAEERLTCQRAADLCEQAAALVIDRAGEDPHLQDAVATRMVRAADPPDRSTHRLRWTLLLPPLAPNLGECMHRPLTPRQRLARQLRPTRRVRDCCRYHSVDWHAANATARRLIRAARRAGHTLAEEVFDHAEASETFAQLPRDQRKAVACLLCPSDGITVERLSGSGPLMILGGRHRLTAMLDAGVRRVVTVAEPG